MKKILLVSIFPLVFFLCMFLMGNIGNRTAAQWWNIIFLMLAYVLMVAGGTLFKAISGSKNHTEIHTTTFGIVYFACQCVAFIILRIFSASTSCIQIVSIILLAMYLLFALSDVLYQQKLK